MEGKYSRAALVLLAGLAGACHYHARSADDYRQAVRDVLDQNQAQITSCYHKELAADPAAAGQVVLKLEVEPKTGKIVNPVIDDVATTSNEQVQQCVTSTLDGLKIDPGDKRKGEGTFTWAFAH
jgi:hypothetical protein